MDSKKIIQKLIKIAENQQKIIMKLAQAQGLPPDALPTSQVSVTDGSQPKPSTDTPPTDLKSNKPVYAPSNFVFNALNADPRTKGMLRHINPPVGNQMMLVFNPGKNTDQNWNLLNKVFLEIKQKNAGLNKDLQLTAPQPSR